MGLKTEARHAPNLIDAALLTRIQTLSPADRMELLGAVWKSFTPEDAPVTGEERKLLDARLADARDNPDDQSPWREVQARLSQQLP